MPFYCIWPGRDLACVMSCYFSLQQFLSFIAQRVTRVSEAYRACYFHSTHEICEFFSLIRYFASIPIVRFSCVSFLVVSMSYNRDLPEDAVPQQSAARMSHFLENGDLDYFLFEAGSCNSPPLYARVILAEILEYLVFISKHLTPAVCRHIPSSSEILIQIRHWTTRLGPRPTTRSLLNENRNKKTRAPVPRCSVYAIRFSLLLLNSHKLSLMILKHTLLPLPYPDGADHTRHHDHKIWPCVLSPSFQLC